MKTVKLNYEGMSNKDLAISGQRVSNNAKLDINELSPLGVTAELLSQLDENIVSLIAVPKHQYVVGEKSKTTIERNDSVAIVEQTAKELRTQTMFVESISTGEHKATFSVSLYRADAKKMIDIASLMLNVLKNSTEDLTLYGITPERISLFESQINDLISKTVTQEQETIGLNDTTSERHAIRAKVTKLLKFVSESGKVYWLKKQKTKWDNYVVTKSPPNSAAVAEPTTESSQTDNSESNF